MSTSESVESRHWLSSRRLALRVAVAVLYCGALQALQPLLGLQPLAEVLGVGGLLEIWAWLIPESLRFSLPIGVLFGYYWFAADRRAKEPQLELLLDHKAWKRVLTQSVTIFVMTLVLEAVLAPLTLQWVRDRAAQIYPQVGAARAVVLHGVDDQTVRGLLGSPDAWTEIERRVSRACLVLPAPILGLALAFARPRGVFPDVGLALVIYSFVEGASSVLSSQAGLANLGGHLAIVCALLLLGTLSLRPRVQTSVLAPGSDHAGKLLIVSMSAAAVWAILFSGAWKPTMVVGAAIGAGLLVFASFLRRKGADAWGPFWTSAVAIAGAVLLVFVIAAWISSNRSVSVAAIAAGVRPGASPLAPSLRSKDASERAAAIDIVLHSRTAHLLSGDDVRLLLRDPPARLNELLPEVAEAALLASLPDLRMYTQDGSKAHVCAAFAALARVGRLSMNERRHLEEQALADRDDCGLTEWRQIASVGLSPRLKDHWRSSLREPPGTGNVCRALTGLFVTGAFSLEGVARAAQSADPNVVLCSLALLQSAGDAGEAFVQSAVQIAARRDYMRASLPVLPLALAQATLVAEMLASPAKLLELERAFEDAPRRDVDALVRTLRVQVASDWFPPRSRLRALRLLAGQGGLTDSEADLVRRLAKLAPRVSLGARTDIDLGAPADWQEREDRCEAFLALALSNRLSSVERRIATQPVFNESLQRECKGSLYAILARDNEGVGVAFARSLSHFQIDQDDTRAILSFAGRAPNAVVVALLANAYSSPQEAGGMRALSRFLAGAKVEWQRRLGVLGRPGKVAELPEGDPAGIELAWDLLRLSSDASPYPMLERDLNLILRRLLLRDTMKSERALLSAVAADSNLEIDTRRLAEQRLAESPSTITTLLLSPLGIAFMLTCTLWLFLANHRRLDPNWIRAIGVGSAVPLLVGSIREHISIVAFLSVFSASLVGLLVASLRFEGPVRWISCLPFLGPRVSAWALRSAAVRSAAFRSYHGRATRELERLREKLLETAYVPVAATLSQSGQSGRDEDPLPLVLRRIGDGDVGITGAGGRGKSAFLRALYGGVLERWDAGIGGALPIRLDVNRECKDIREVVRNELGITMTGGFVEALLDEGRLVFFADDDGPLPSWALRNRERRRASLVLAGRTLEPDFVPTLTVEPLPFDEPSVNRFFGHYRPGEALVGPALRACRTGDGSFSPLLVKLVAVSGGLGATTQAEVFTNAIRKLTRNDTALIKEAQAVCERTFWQTGDKLLKDSIGEAAFPKLEECGLLVRQQHSPGLRFFHDEILYFLTVSSFCSERVPQLVDALLCAAGNPMFFDKSSPCETPLFRTWREAFVVPDSDSRWLGGTLRDWANTYGAAFSAADVWRPIAVEQRERIAAAPDALMRAVAMHEGMNPADACQGLAMVFAAIAPSVWRMRHEESLTKGWPRAGVRGS